MKQTCRVKRGERAVLHLNSKAVVWTVTYLLIIANYDMLLSTSAQFPGGNAFEIVSETLTWTFATPLDVKKCFSI